MWVSRRRRRLNALLSAYLDGELDAPAQDEATDHIVLDPASRATLDAYAAADRLVGQALAPPAVPDWSAAADRLLSRCRAPESPPTASSLLPTRRRHLPTRRRHLAPAVVASVGILVTAGVTFLGLRRRGIV